MKLKSTIFAVLLVAAPTFAQTVTQLLEKGIYAQETSGNLDEAVLVFRQIVNSASGQRDIAAQAQYRLADTLIRKGDLTNAATEFQKLARDYPDQETLISRLASHLPAAGGGGLGPTRGDRELINGSALETQKLLELQMQRLKRELEDFNQHVQSSTGAAEIQSKMDAVKAQLVDLQARIAAGVYSNPATQGKSK